jgi:hypothetical protein
VKGRVQTPPMRSLQVDHVFNKLGRSEGPTTQYHRAVSSAIYPTYIPERPRACRDG